MKKSKNFKFWVPLTISKSKNEAGEEEMKIGGIASTIDEDSDGEVLDPKGFDLKPLMSTGVLNWHHQQKSSPAAIIGEPTKAEIRKDGLYLEGILYKDSELAKQVFGLAQTLEANSKTRRLGFSIEGKALEKDKNNENRITRATITGCAITYMPKNPSTFLNILKGETGDEPEYEETEDVSQGGDVKYILDMVTKDGKTIRVTKEGEIIIDLSKSISTDSDSGKALKPEHVDGSMKVTADKTIVTSGFKKSELYDKIFSDLPDIDILKAKQIFTIIHKIHDMSKQTSTKKTLPSKEDIEKAYTLLGISKAATVSDIEKAEDDEEKEEKEEVKKSVKKAIVKKADEDDKDEKEKAEDDDDKDEKEKAEDDEKDEKEVKKSKIKKADKEEEEEEEEDEKEKAEDDDDNKDEKEKADDDKDEDKKDEKPAFMKKGNHYEKFVVRKGELVKADTEMYDKIGNSFKPITSEKKIEKAINDFTKGQEGFQKALGVVLADITNDNKKFQESILNRLEAMEKGSPGRKSIVKSVVREKNFDSEVNETIAKGGDGKKVLDITKRSAVLAALEKAVYEPLSKGQQIDAGFEKAMTAYESTRSLSPAILQRLQKEYGYTLVKGGE